MMVVFSKEHTRSGSDADFMSVVDITRPIRTTAPALAPRGTRTGLSPAVVALVVALLAATVYGGWRVASAAPPAPADGLPTLVVGGARFSVAHVERVTGLTDADLSGMGHGIQGLVRDDSMLLRVALTVTAGDDRTVFDASRLRLVRSGHAPQPPVGGSVGRGTLEPHASVEGILSFIVPRDGAGLQLGATGTSARLALGHVDEAPHGAGHMSMNMSGAGGAEIVPPTTKRPAQHRPTSQHRPTGKK
jgi:hypothetical protein